MNQESTKINKSDIPNNDAFKKTLEDILEKYGLEAYHKYLIDGRIPEEVKDHESKSDRDENG
jgi:hypothetical protein